MNENNKQLLLDYFVGSIEETRHDDTPKIAKVKEYNKNLTEEIKNYDPNLDDWEINFQLERNDFFVLFCSSSHLDGFDWFFTKSFIIVVNKRFEIIKYFDSYSSGISFNKFSRTIDNDSSEGTIYAIDNIIDESSNIVKQRIILLNDFTLEDDVQLLNSWYIPNYNNNLITPISFYKKLDEGKYFLTWKCYNNNYDVIYTGALEFINNVGSENEWNWFPYNGNLKVDILASQPIWIDNELNFKIFSSQRITENNNHNTQNICILTRNNENCVVQQILALPIQCKNVGQIMNAVMLGDSVMYYTQTSLSTLQNTKYVIMLNLNDYTSKIYYDKEDYIYEKLENCYRSSYDDISIFTKNGMFYFYRIYHEYTNYFIDNVWHPNYEHYDLYLNQIFNNEKFEYFVYDGKEFVNSGSSFDCSFSCVRVYDLYNFNIIYPTKIIQAIQIFNPTRYNGIPYISSQSLNAESAILYNEEDPIFARGLYNKTVNDNVAVYILEIPYNLLNNEMINNKSIISKTNTNIIDDNTSMSKNVYETVYLNYVHLINIIDNNDNKFIISKEGSSRLCHSINSDNDYINQYISKARVVYYDNTNEIKKLNLSKIEEDNYEVEFTINVLKNINYIELISNDETTVYQKIELDNLELNKIYKIKQRIRKG